jgi:hypothetical protein
MNTCRGCAMSKAPLNDHEYIRIAESGPRDPFGDPEYCHRKARQLYNDIVLCHSSAAARQIFLKVISSKRRVQRDQNAELLARFLGSGLTLGKFAATVAAECGKKVETVQTVIGRAQTLMRQDKDFEDHVRFLTHWF